VTARLEGTQFEGFTPDSRVGVWAPVFQSCLDHIFIGHGPWYDTGRGLVRVYWPHNGFLYYLHTLGLFGLAAFVVIVFKLYRISTRYNRPAAYSGFVGVALSVTGVQLAELIVAQMRTDHQRTTDSIYMFIVWLVFGLIAASGNVLRRKEEESAAAAVSEEAPAPPPGAEPPGGPAVGFRG
jgi:O-antigen ligase